MWSKELGAFTDIQQEEAVQVALVKNCKKRGAVEKLEQFLCVDCGILHEWQQR